MDGEFNAEEYLGTKATYPPASVTLKNALPSEWRIKLTELGCKFIYDDGTNDDKFKNVNISSGGSDSLFASYSGCCRAYALVAKAIAPDGEVFPLINFYTVDQQFCGGELTWTIVAEGAFTKGQYGQTPRIKGILEAK